ncbi:MAG TPA: hypothetical protein VFA79_07405 [Myxococcales bacterium]|nr:hypothetical protein [Myxococcales bacterium]
MARKLLGTLSNLTVRKRVYLAPDAVEIDEIDGYTGTRRRVLLDEVLLVTLDRRRRWLNVFIWIGIGAMFSMPSMIMALSARAPGGASGAAFAVTAIIGAPFILVALAHLLVGTDYVTVFGKRTVAQMAFSLRKGRARSTFALVRERVQQAQERARTAAADGSAQPETGDPLRRLS